MSSVLLKAGRLDREFLYNSAGNPNEQKLRYNDPSFITFRILFDFDPIVSNDEVTQGLLLFEERDESAISYLRRMGEKERAEALKEFTWMLNRISNDFPWFFKSVSGIDNLWKWGYPKASGEDNESAPVTLTVSCYETVDFRMTALADLYRKSTWDRRFFRNLLTIDKRRFNMTVIVGEARNLRTFIDPNNTEWLNHVSAMAFRCLDCEFDFSSIAPSTVDASEAPAQMSPSFSIKVNRVQETNSYQLLNYVLGEMTRDLSIVQGGSGAEVNINRDLIDYRSLLSPLIRSYEGNYEQLLIDSIRFKQENLVNNINFINPDRTFTIPYEDRQRINNQFLNSISQEQERNQMADSILNSILTSNDIVSNTVLINFARPNVETDISGNIQFNRPTVSRDLSGSVDMDEEKLPEEVQERVEFIRPSVQNELSDVSLVSPKVQETIDSNISLNAPKVNTDIDGFVNLDTPTVSREIGEPVNLQPPTVDEGIDQNVGLRPPVVQNDISGDIDFVPPTVEDGFDFASIQFGRPSVDTSIDSDISFVAPNVVDDISGDIQFIKPKVEENEN